MNYPVVVLTVSGYHGVTGFLIGRSENHENTPWPWMVHAPSLHRSDEHFLLRRNEFIIKNALNRRSNV